jgi:hypothetical protein
LDHVPVLDDFAVFYAEDVYYSAAAVFGAYGEVAVGDYQVAFGDDGRMST